MATPHQDRKNYLYVCVCTWLLDVQFARAGAEALEYLGGVSGRAGEGASVVALDQQVLVEVPKPRSTAGLQLGEGVGVDPRLLLAPLGGQVQQLLQGADVAQAV